jgi:hypothetical protein
MRKKKVEKLYSANTAVTAADAFRTHSKMFIDNLPKGSLDKASQFASRNLGELIASATTLTLALELYLKALRIITGFPAAETHHLWNLYKHLPVDLKKAIETQYNQLNMPQVGKLAALELEVSTEPFKDNTSDENEYKSNNFSNDLKSVHIRSSDAFVTWRYIHEGAKKGEYVKYDYEFYHLELICDITRSHLTAIL